MPYLLYGLFETASRDDAHQHDQQLDKQFDVHRPSSLTMAGTINPLWDICQQQIIRTFFAVTLGGLPPARPTAAELASPAQAVPLSREVSDLVRVDHQGPGGDLLAPNFFTVGH
jgi:hypothetical protein